MAESNRTATDERTDRASVAFEGPPTLVTWCLGTFHVAMLTVVAILLLQRGNAVGGALSGLDTAIGLGLYGLLWTLTWWTTHRGLRAAWRDGRGPTWTNGLASALVWGGVTGVVFFAGLFAALLVVLVVDGADVLATLGVGAIGAFVAVLVGAIVGGVLGLIDLVLLRTARTLGVPAPNDRD